MGASEVGVPLNGLGMEANYLTHQLELGQCNSGVSRGVGAAVGAVVGMMFCGDMIHEKFN
jgi:hypothetical protein